jgi:hypothetical protein
LEEKIWAAICAVDSPSRTFLVEENFVKVLGSVIILSRISEIIQSGGDIQKWTVFSAILDKIKTL